MVRSKTSIFVALTLLAGAAFQAEGAALIEKDGRFEWNWSTGKVRFYGAAISEAADGSTWRPAEQRAWSEGLTHAEQALPASFAKKIGPVHAETPTRFSKLVATTNSVHTTYFGDNRLRVVLESPIAAVLKQVNVESSSPIAANDSGNIVLKTGKSTAPSAVFSIVDEQGRELVAAKHLAASIAAGAPIPRWFKGSASAADVPAQSKPTEIKATSAGAGVLKVQSADWRPEYAGLVASGRAAVVVQ